MRGGIPLTSAAKAVGGGGGVNAALKALRHPKGERYANPKALLVRWMAPLSG